MNSHEDFHKAVELERETLTRLADYWSDKIKCDINFAKETEGRIRAAVGKTQLLLAEKFKQFEGLLEKSENKTTEKEISFNDLLGFWELVLLQVKEIKDIFQSFGPLTDKVNSEILESSNDAKNVQKIGIKGNKRATSSKKKLENSFEQTEEILEKISSNKRKVASRGL